MNIIILGAGRVGESVAESLVSERNDITIIDTDPRRLRPEIPEGLVAILKRACQKDPDDRFTSAHEMAQALDALLGTSGKQR